MRFLLSQGPRRGLLGFLVGVYAVLWGLDRMVSDPKLRRLAALPLGITALLYLMVLVGLFVWGDDLMHLVWPRPVESDRTIYLWWGATLLFVVVFLAASVLLFAPIAEAVGGAFYDHMAIRILASHGISTREVGFVEGLFPDIFRPFFFVVPALIFGVLGLVPVLGWMFVAAGTGMAWLGFASGAINPSLMVTQHPLRERLGWLRSHLMTSLGMGAVVATSMLIMPLLGLVAIPASITGAAELYGRAHARKADDGRPAAPPAPA